MKKLESDVMNWLSEKYEEAPPEGWRTINWIASHKGVSITSAERSLQKFIESKKMPPPKKFRVSGRVVRYFFVGI